jgi:exo-beta-1,3-glucanase (GH17 family)
LVPTPIAQTCPTPGTYTFPATTVVVTETTTVCAASTTKVPSGTHTLGGVTTVVTTSTTVVCPYATTTTDTKGVVTSVILTTTYVCPSAGTYTIAPHVTTVTATETVVVVPVITEVCPGTYVAPATVTTVTETDIVVYCPFTSVSPTTYTILPSSPAETGAPAKPTDTPSIGSGGKQWAITYTPYNSDGTCKSPSEVMSDITEIKNIGFTTVRVYSTDCDTLPNVGAACKSLGLKVIIGIFIGQPGCDNASPHVSEQVAALTKWAQWDIVELAVIGNEAAFNGFCSIDQLRDLIVSVKGSLKSAGYTGPCTTTEVLSTWVDHDVEEICDVIDVVAINAHAYFNAATLPEAAGTFVAGQLDIARKVCNKPAYVMESGWPSAGICYEKACAGPDQQAKAIDSIKTACGEYVVFFSYSNDAWKAPGACGCERNWGVGQLFSS